MLARIGKQEESVTACEKALEVYKELPGDNAEVISKLEMYLM